MTSSRLTALSGRVSRATTTSPLLRSSSWSSTVPNTAASAVGRPPSQPMTMVEARVSATAREMPVAMF